MILEKIRTEGIAHNSYFLGSGKEAIVVDPRRDCDVYVNLQKKYGMKIKYIFETHRHEDFVSGSEELALRTKAEIRHGAQLNFDFGTVTREADEFSIGDLTIGVLETPGHTMESISITVTDRTVSEKKILVFTGDCLFAGGVGRTDLLGESRRAQMSEMLYESISKKLFPLGNHVVICPAHGKGSICGGDISDQEFATIGYERETNPLFGKTKEDFLKVVGEEHHYIPPYFKMMEEDNLIGPPVLPQLPVVAPLSIAAVKKYMDASVQMLDIRSPTSFSAGHIPGSLNIWRSGLPQYAGWFLSYNKPIIIIDDFNTNLEEAVRFLVRLGFDSIAGCVADGFSGWCRAAAPVEQINVWTLSDFFAHHSDDSLFILDVREVKNWNKEGHIPGAHHLYVGKLPGHFQEVPKDMHIVVYCDSGYKTSIASSLLKQQGYPHVTIVLGGFSAWKNAGYPVETMEVHHQVTDANK